MVLFLSRQPKGYTRIEESDPEEVQHRKAQFMIYKSLQKVDSMQRKSTSCLKVKVCRLKIRIGRRLRKSIVVMSVVAVVTRSGLLYKPVVSHLRSLKRFLIRSRNDHQQSAAITLSPIMF